MASARKRPRPESEDNNRAECPFSVKMVDNKEREQKKKKRRRTDGGEEDDGQRLSLQMSPFSPSGKFKTYETMDLYYQVDPYKKWMDMTRYNSFVLNGVKYFSEGFVYVANDSSIERQKAVANNEPMQPRKKSDDDWVARILEIRASDEHHVYARIYWMYWPDELPQGSLDGKKTISGRQTYHGINELVASNHMDIINVVSVTSQASVKQWYEDIDEEILQNTLYWRQAFDVRTYELSTVETVCSCHTPENPDKRMIGCTTEPCKKWLHEQCIKDAALKATFERLGTTKPHLSAEPVKAEKDGEEAKRPLSPTETGAAVSAQHSIDVKADIEYDNAKDNVEVKQPEDEEPTPVVEGSQPEASAEPAATDKSEADADPNSTPSKATPGRKPGRVKKRVSEANGTSAKPWEGLFEVNIMTDSIPTQLEFKDLREGIVGGEKTWYEPIKCLVCHSQIN